MFMHFSVTCVEQVYRGRALAEQCGMVRVVTSSMELLCTVLRTEVGSCRNYNHANAFTLHARSSHRLCTPLKARVLVS